MSIPVPEELIPLLVQMPFVAVIIWLVLYRDKHFRERYERQRGEFQQMRREERAEFQKERELWRETIKQIERNFREAIGEAEERWREELREHNERFIQHSRSNRETVSRILQTVEKLTEPRRIATAILDQVNSIDVDRREEAVDAEGIPPIPSA